METISSNRWSTYIDHGDGTATATINTRSIWYRLHMLRWRLAAFVAPMPLDTMCLYPDDGEVG